MDSINLEQPEINRADFLGVDAVERLRDTVKNTSTCFFCTCVSTGSQATRPRSVQVMGVDGALWVLSASDSHKNAEIGQNPLVWLFFEGSGHFNCFAALSGT